MKQFPDSLRHLFEYGCLDIINDKAFFKMDGRQYMQVKDIMLGSMLSQRGIYFTMKNAMDSDEAN